MQENIMKLLKRNFKVLGIYGSLLILYTFTLLHFYIFVYIFILTINTPTYG